MISPALAPALTPEKEMMKNAKHAPYFGIQRMISELHSCWAMEM
jgi:hypothetical protein